MEEEQAVFKIGGVPFTAANKLVINNDRAHRSSLAKTTHSIHCPDSAMEFLSRSWSPSASSFLEMFSSSDLQLPTDDSNSTEDHEEQLAVTQKCREKRNTTLTTNNSRKMDFPAKGWLKVEPFAHFFRSCKEKRKEEIRFHTANLHAALSLTKLAAAIAGFASSTNDNNHKNIETGAQYEYEGMGSIVATAATLMTTVCGEAAESLGAHRSQVASAVNSGLAISTPIDMMAATATAATCLRGAAILKSRMMADSCPRVRETLKVCNQICIITPSGGKEYKYVTMYSKHRYIRLCFQKKYFGGTLTTSKEYKVLSIEETMENEGNFFLSLKTNNGTIKLLLEDEKQLRIWVSTISNLQKMHNPHHRSGNRPHPF